MNVLKELLKRRVFRAAVIYAAAAWAVTEIITTIFDRLLFPDWTGMLVVIAFLVGFPVAMYLSWAFDITAEGVRRTEPMSPQGWRAIGGSAAMLVGGTAILFLLLKPGERDFPGPAAPAVAANSIAVLPFANVSGDDANDYLAEGIAETLLHSLSQTTALRVIARDSSFQLRDRRMAAVDKARVLGVAYLLDGSVQVSGEQVRVIARLIDGASGAYLFSENFDGTLSLILDIQDAISTAVTTALTRQLSEAVGRPVYSIDAEAYDLYLRGLYQLNDASPASLMRAVGYFTGAIELDPEFALAYVGRVNARVVGFGLDEGVGPSEGWAPIRWATELSFLPETYRLELDRLEAMVHGDIEKAKELRPDLAETHTAAGLLRFLKGDLEGAESDLRGAIARNPSNAFAHHMLGLLLRARHRFDESADELEIALALGPLSYTLNYDLALAESFRGDFDAFDAYMQRLLKLDSERLTYYWYRASFLPLMGRYREATEHAIAWLETEPEDESIEKLMNFNYSVVGKSEPAWRLGRELGRYVPPPDGDAQRYLDWTMTRALVTLRSDDVRDEYENLLRTIVESDSNVETNSDAYSYAARYAIRMGEFNEAEELLATLSGRVVPEQWPYNLWDLAYHMPFISSLDLALVRRAMGDEEQAAELVAETAEFLDRLEESGFGSPALTALRAKVSALAGDEDRALDLLEEYAQDPASSTAGVQNDVAFRNIAANRRYAAALRTIREREEAAIRLMDEILVENGYERITAD